MKALNICVLTASLLVALSAVGCKDLEKSLLEPKLYFENLDELVTVGTEAEVEHQVMVRISTAVPDEQVISILPGDASLLEKYNAKGGTDYKILPSEYYEIPSGSFTIPANQLYAERLSIKLKKLNEIPEGTTYVLPVKLQSQSGELITGEDVSYIKVQQPYRITKSTLFGYNTFMNVPVGASYPFTSMTCEALVYMRNYNTDSSTGYISTIMGNEDYAMMRFDNDKLSVAGAKTGFGTGDTKYDLNKWYHVAFTYNGLAKTAVIYINGEKKAEMGVSADGLSGIGKWIVVGKIDGFKWGERVFDGQMAEVRVWDVARSESEIRNNMLGVDPATPGLAAYYKCNEAGIVEKDGLYYFKDETGHGYDAKAGNGSKPTLVEHEPIILE